jgi:hypothetical protein
MGESEVVEVDLAALGVGEEALQRLGVEPGSKTTVWRPKKEKGQFVERPEMEEGEKHGYLSVNAYTIDAGQGIDLPAWTEKKWVMYLDGYNGTDEESYQKPQIGGAY